MDWSKVGDFISGVTDKFLDYKKAALGHNEGEVYGPPMPATDWSQPQTTAGVPSWLPWVVVVGLAIFLLKGK